MRTTGDHLGDCFLAADDTHGTDMMESCLDFSLILDGQDFDEQEIMRTLVIETQDEAALQRVGARFSNFSDPNHIEFVFRKVDGKWLIDDIASLSDPKWRWSEIPCEPAKLPRKGAR